MEKGYKINVKERLEVRFEVYVGNNLDYSYNHLLDVLYINFTSIIVNSI